MGKRKRATGRFLRIGEEIYKSAAWRALPASATRLWLDLRQLNNGHNNGRISPTISTMRALGWNSKSKLARALALLVQHGFVKYTRKSSPNVFHRASRVRFTDIPCPEDEREGIDGCGPTWDFLQVKASQFAVPRKRGRTAPESGTQPPPNPGNGGPEPPPNPGNAAKPDFHRENGGPGDTSRRSPDSGDVLELAMPTGNLGAPDNAAGASTEGTEALAGGSMILRQTDLTRQAAMRKAARGKA